MKNAPLLLTLLCLLLAGCNPSVPPTVEAVGKAVPVYSITFQDIAKRSGLNLERTNGAFGKRWMPETMGGGGGFLDYDGDGWLDILIVNNPQWPGQSPTTKSASPALLLYHNNHDGTFTDVTRESGLTLTDYGMGVAVGDYDNDGYDDLVITAVGRSHLFHNIPDGKGGRKFADVTAASGINDTGWATSAAFLDYDNDGKLDLFICHYLKWSPETNITCGTTVPAYCRPQEYPGESCRLYRNLGNGRFTDVTRQAGLYNPNAKGLGVCVCDFNDDGFPDLIVANDTEPNFLYKNSGKGSFTEIGQESGIALDDNGKPRAGMGLDMADIRGEGTQGVAIGNFSFEGIALYEVQGAPPWRERSRQSGIYAASYPLITFGLFFADFDNDGLPDLFATNGHIEDNIALTNPGQTYPQPNLLYRNMGNTKFTESSKVAGAGITEPMVGRAACRGDFDNDGKPDILLIPNIGSVRLLHNTTPQPGHFLTLRLVGTKSNRNAYGAKVTIETLGKRQTALVHSGSSYLSANDSRLHFGLGSATSVGSVTVRWPSGATQTWKALPADKILTLTEGKEGY